MIELSVCIGSACHLKGSYNVIQAFQRLIEENLLHDKIQLKSRFCLRQCQNPGVAVSIDDESFNVSPEAASEFFKTKVMERAAAIK